MIGDDHGRALFPISLSNQDFSTGVVFPLIGELFERYETIMFLVADHLQIYNKALLMMDGVVLSDIIAEFSAGRRYLEQRTKWIARTIINLDNPIDERRWSVVGVDDFVDADCFRIFRNVMLAYYASPEFRKDVDWAAQQHANVRQHKYPLEQRRLLSRGYLLEEIAVSIRIHIIGGVRDEFYIGTQTTPVLGVYDGRYGFNAFDLAERDDDGSKDQFFRLKDDADEREWVLASTLIRTS